MLEWILVWFCEPSDLKQVRFSEIVRWFFRLNRQLSSRSWFTIALSSWIQQAIQWQCELHRTDCTIDFFRNPCVWHAPLSGQIDWQQTLHDFKCNVSRSNERWRECCLQPVPWLDIYCFEFDLFLWSSPTMAHTDIQANCGSKQSEWQYQHLFAIAFWAFIILQSQASRWIFIVCLAHLGCYKDHAITAAQVAFVCLPGTCRLLYSFPDQETKVLRTSWCWLTASVFLM